MGKVDDYRERLRTIASWDPYLLAESGLPGPRANIELARAAAEEAGRRQIEEWLTWDSERAPTSEPAEFLAFCGVLGLGRLGAAGDRDAIERLRTHASDRRWRVREAVAMSLERLGRVDFEHLLVIAQEWSEGTRLEQRAAVAALCRPALLTTRKRTARVRNVVMAVTASLVNAGDKASEELRILRKALGYCWSIIVVADPEAGRPAMAEWIESGDADVRWVIRENLKKRRLVRLDESWVEEQIERVRGR